ncbi:MAG: hypothetical protein LQ340_001898 [Diploschistes diacapsis]|nr:MAG: hypothetical protein LQ340_001898 [Diploschistes diacapsis]
MEGDKRKKKRKRKHADIDKPESSPLHIQRASLYLSIPPVALRYASRGLCAEVLSSLLLKYYSPMQGVVTAYDNVQLSANPSQTTEEGPSLAISFNEYAEPFIWITADFLLFRPRRGDRIPGWVNLQNESHLGLVCWNLFNVSLARAHLPKKWNWIEPTASQSKSKARLKGGAASTGSHDHGGVNGTEMVYGPSDYQGHYEDENGTPIPERISFLVNDVEASSSTDREKSYLAIEGTMVQDTGEVREDGDTNTTLDAQVSRKRSKKGKSSG